MTVTIVLKVKYVSEDVSFDCGSLPIEFFDQQAFQTKMTSSPSGNSTGSSNHSTPQRKAGPCKRKQQVKWSEEDDRILRMYAEKEYSWKEIATNFLHDKFTPQQLHQRWKRVLNDNINREPWTEEEDRAIIEYVKKHGCSWSKLRTLLGTRRTDTMVRQRWLKITNGQGEVGTPSNKHKSNMSSKSPSSSMNSSSYTNLVNQSSSLSNNYESMSALLNGTSADMDVFQFIKTHQLMSSTNFNQAHPVTVVPPVLNKPTPVLSADALTCDEELTFEHRPAPSEPIRRDSLDEKTLSSNLGTMLENNIDLVDFHSSFQANMEKEWLNQIFSGDF
ncbi:hypothetical protein C9374_011584 [Naegleria lovaniensis]|uniref:Myb-like DNA-binding domain containing protein n=1 Tax=Naegleria lovaniensis TaxID=51637 RepID=A0AA88GG09_NAELO|nr:uncharacterized protein C9374_011584 [Naegleria lovaniensis]KAG2373919.1 hypothetical protein C9374_011584 [Naegleria lovaniensis]